MESQQGGRIDKRRNQQRRPVAVPGRNVHSQNARHQQGNQSYHQCHAPPQGVISVAPQMIMNQFGVYQLVTGNVLPQQQAFAQFNGAHGHGGLFAFGDSQPVLNYAPVPNVGGNNRNRSNRNRGRRSRQNQQGFGQRTGQKVEKKRNRGMTRPDGTVRQLPVRGKFSSSASGTPHLASTASGVFGLIMKNQNMTYDQFKDLTLTEQLNIFMATQTTTSEEREKREQIVVDIESVIRSHFPNCKLYPFGSHLTGLGDSKSDMDIYVDLYGDGGQLLQSAGKKYTQDTRDVVLKILKKAKCPRNYGKIAKGQVTKMNNKAILIRMHHAEHGIQCDLSFANRLSVCNTELLKFYMEFDPRVKPFLIFLRTWAKYIGVAHETKIKKYAISLMALLYLMQKKIIPSVELLQTLSAAERKSKGISGNPDQVNGWDGSFCKDRQLIEQNFDLDPFVGVNNLVTGKMLVEMAMEFFEMFGNLNYSNTMICPLVGNFLPKRSFAAGHEHLLPESLQKAVMKNRRLGKELKIESSLLVIQDPFVLNYNVVVGLSKQGILHRFRDSCKNTFQNLKNKTGEVESILDLFITGKPGPNKEFNDGIKKDLKLEVDCEEIEPSEPMASSSMSLAPQATQVQDEKQAEEKIISLRLDADILFAKLLTRKLAQLRTLDELADIEKKSTISRLIAVLWQEFGEIFVRDMLENGLNLRLEEDTAFPKITTDSSGNEGDGWDGEMMMELLKEESGKLKRITRSSQDQAKLFRDTVLQKASIYTGECYSKMWKLHISYPFWEGDGRQGVMSYGPHNINPIEEEKKISDPILTQFMLHCWRRGKGHASDEEETSGVNRVFAEFSAFKLSVELKIEALLEQRPRMTIQLKDELDPNAPEETLKLAKNSLLQIFENAFSAYQMYELTQWLKG